MADNTTRIKYRPATELVYVDNSDGKGPKDNYNAASMPIYQTATFKQQSSTQMGEYDYSRSGNPTRSHVENHLAKIMSAKRAFAVNSGMTALDVITRLVKANEEVIAGNDLYGGTNRLLSFLATHNNVKTHHIDTTNSEAIIPYLSEKTRLVLLETPTNPLMKIADIPRISEIVHERCPNALVVVDNTMMSPYLQRPLELGADIVYHSGTKYLSGHHDLMAGVVAVKDDAIADKIYFTINATGVGLGPFDCWLLMRGVKTLAVRMDRQQASAMKIADFLQAHNFKVHYPGLKTHPQYELHAKMSAGPGAVLSFETGDVELSEKLVELTRLWGISVSFGCVNSLISMPCRMSHASIPAAVRAERAMPEDLIRLCVGIEDVEDLLEDLYHALTTSGALKLAN
ncbi:cystathionine beta-lyase [Lobosporangium transversale]|uniref:Cystathionine beta-lyase n=1 Tax=Lobosporangium transversale TaxID=64571 RepID=A0A1Y2GIY4_9FUNG|nr:cystathionine beta-lyase [Lobosporangium transversale]KAF9897646.1 cystathionine beta-lyase [Lobosporangium transversale]ORZ12185.1 cystathionine beta-lyase [Lobosporangium transversale]|eukprot:XP_021880050.1 cystathionine beta-lyase [Lobosporangium transversale]